MTEHPGAGSLNFMRRAMFAAMIPALFGGVAQAQFPGRDLLEYPVSGLAEPSPLAVLVGDGVRNPATILLPEGSRFRVGAASLQTPAAQGVSSNLVSAAVRGPRDATLGVSVVRAGVSDLVRTWDDPQTAGGQIPYVTTMLSVAVATRRDHLVGAVAVRYRYSEVDTDRLGLLGLDGGFVAEQLFGRDIRLGASTFLWSPGDAREAFYTVAGDVRVAGTDSLRQGRVGVSASFGGVGKTEHYLFGSARYGFVRGHGGLVRMAAGGNSDWRMRLGAGLHHARYTIGLAQEENGAGVPSTYQFSLSALF